VSASPQDPSDRARALARALAEAQSHQDASDRARAFARALAEALPGVTVLMSVTRPMRKTKTDDDRLPEHRVLALIEGMPRCLRPAGDLRAAILEALMIYRVERCDRWLPSPAEAQRHAKRLAKTARKLLALLKDRKTLIDNEEQWALVTGKLPAALRELIEMADLAAQEPEFDDDDAMTWLLRRLVGIYEWASGAPAKLPWNDRITGEDRGPLLNFMLIAAADAFSEQPMTPNAIRHRLRKFMSTGERTAKIYCHCPVQSACGAVTPDTTTGKRVVVSNDGTNEAETDGRVIRLDRGGAGARHRARNP
jgi:hypothetical protein